MKRLRWLTLTLIGTAALALAETPPPPATAVAPEGGKAAPAANPEMMRERMRRLAGGDGEGMVLRMLITDPRAAKELELSDGQIQQIKESVSGSSQELRDLNARIETAALRQAELMRADALDEEAVLKAVQETGELRTQIAKLRIKQLMAAHRVLTPDQRAKVREMMAHRVQQARQRLQEGGREAPRRGREGRAQRQGQDQSSPTPPPPPPPPADE
jgi:Spy/CpxP family protein refolding chaperone